MDLNDIRAAYSRGENVMELLRARESNAENELSAIEVAYDLQAGSYTHRFLSAEGRQFSERFGGMLASLLPAANYGTVLDAGVGEATSIIPFLHALGGSPKVYAFDTSVSRLLWARTNLQKEGFAARLFIADTAAIPLQDASIDLVVSIHSVEPNGGRELDLLSELVRVARRYVVLIEPSPEFATSEQQSRMRALGYAMGIRSALDALNVEVVKHGPWPLNANPANPAAVTILKPRGNSIRKQQRRSQKSADNKPYVSPGTLEDLIALDAGHFAPKEGLYFPSVSGLPVLRRDRAILASQLLDFHR